MQVSTKLGQLLLSANVASAQLFFKSYCPMKEFFLDDTSTVDKLIVNCQYHPKLPVHNYAVTCNFAGIIVTPLSGHCTERAQADLHQFFTHAEVE